MLFQYDEIGPVPGGHRRRLVFSMVHKDPVTCASGGILVKTYKPDLDPKKGYLGRDGLFSGCREGKKRLSRVHADGSRDIVSRTKLRELSRCGSGKKSCWIEHRDTDGLED